MVKRLAASVLAIDEVEHLALVLVAGFAGQGLGLHLLALGVVFVGLGPALRLAEGLGDRLAAILAADLGAGIEPQAVRPLRILEMALAGGGGRGRRDREGRHV